ncbi:response regulator [Shewanella sp. Scap07]|uniref:winged helix-turn-helix domain-containing protein n=1 Tax=Shewanella sp. Scap07 TaxID=2589987 RepID=UPI0015C02895|nr:winged helix-turn-helix domain-containing protein [Shewanella sp. Scap07]QLE84245.1 response regulator [Shewanella sp. Scap07]
MWVEFEPFSIDCESRQLLIDGQKVPADDRLFSLMALLIANAPNWVSKQQCLQVCWPDTVVSDLSLSKLVSQGRKLFKQSGCQINVIETVHGRGYRLSNELKLRTRQSLEDETHHNQALISPQVPQYRRLVSTFKWPLLVTTMVLVLGISFVQFTSRPDLIHSESAGSLGRILWVDDNPSNNDIERQFFNDKQLSVYSVVTSEEALKLLGMYHYDVVISDMGRHGDPLAGMKLLQRMRAAQHANPFYLYTIAASPGLRDTLSQHDGQGAAVTSNQLYKLVLSHF